MRCEPGSQRDPKESDREDLIQLDRRSALCSENEEMIKVNIVKSKNGNVNVNVWKRNPGSGEAG